jgi:hypothetical protein
VTRLPAHDVATGANASRGLGVRRVVGVALALAAAPSHAAPCVARAELDGDTATMAQVSAELARLGVEQGRASPGCRGVMARVERSDDGGIAVAIRDGARRSEGRIVGDAMVAATWIDSWLRDDLDGTSWLLATPSIVAARPLERAATTSALDRVAIAVTYEQSWLEDAATATGVGAAACLRVGGACLGVRARHASEGERAVNLTAMARGDTSVLATASTELAIGRLRLAPEVGLGVGRTTTRRVEACAGPSMPANCDPTDPTMDPMCVPMPAPGCADPATGMAAAFVGDRFSRTTYTPRLGGALRLVVPLFDHVWLDGLASITFGPFGHTDDFTVTTLADGTVPGGAPPTEVALPGESRRALVLGIGIRVGAP